MEYTLRLGVLEVLHVIIYFIHFGTYFHYSLHFLTITEKVIAKNLWATCKSIAPDHTGADILWS